MDRMELAEAVTRYLGARGWLLGCCETCGRSFVALVHRTTCGAASCAQLDGCSVAPARSRQPVFWDDVWPTVRNTFERMGFSTTSRADLVNHLGQTRFVGAGLQIFEPALYRGADVPHGRLFVPQPAIRLNYLDKSAGRRSLHRLRQPVHRAGISGPGSLSVAYGQLARMSCGVLVSRHIN